LKKLMEVKRPTVVAVSGFSSNVGKTTLMCELLRRLPGWEAIKVTRGHYRSCGKDPVACCVSDLLRDEPVIRSGREANYEAGKDTGHFWDAGATNVHWVIVNDQQVESGIKQALARVESNGVLIEGNSYLDYVSADFAVMCVRSDGGKVKTSARKALKRSDILYLSSLGGGMAARQEFEKWRAEVAIDLEFNGLPIFTREDLPELITLIRHEFSTVR
jgi:hypothetical protein